MLLNEKSTILNDIINSLSVFSSETDANKTAIYNYILYNYGQKTISPLLENITDSTILCDILTLKYGKKWDYLKTITDSDVSPTKITDSTTEKTDVSVYGFNDVTGTNDTSTVRTITDDKEYSDVFGNMSKAIDFYSKFQYYYYIVKDIANELTTWVYE